MKIKIRFNKTRGTEGRGSLDHVWRVFVGKKEYLAKQVYIEVPSKGEKECCSEDWNIVCEGEIQIDKINSAIYVKPFAQR